MTSNTTITIIKSHDKYRIAQHEELLPEEKRRVMPTEQRAEKKRYNFRPIKTFILVSDKAGHTKVVDCYIIREGA